MLSRSSAADQMPAHAVRFTVGGRYREQQDLHSVHLGLFDCFGEVVVAGDEEEHIGCPVAGMGHQVEADPKIDALLLAVDAEPSESELHFREFADAFLLRVRDPVAGRVVPIHPQHRQFE